MQSHTPIPLEHDSSEPIIIPGQEIQTTSTGNSNSSFMPESYQTAQSFKQSPTQYPFSSSVNSVSSQPHITNSYQHQFMNNNLRAPYATSPGGAFSSPRADPPSYHHHHRPSFTENSQGQKLFQGGQSMARPSLLTSKLASQNSVTQLPSIQQQAHIPGEQQQPQQQTYGSSFRPSSLRSSVIQGDASASTPQNPLSYQHIQQTRSDNINIQQPTTSQHFNASGSVNSYTPHHNTPSVVSDSYTSNPGSVPTMTANSQPSSSLQGFNQIHRTQPTSSVATEHARFADFSKPQESSFVQRGGFPTQLSVQHEDNHQNPHAIPQQQQQLQLHLHAPPPLSTQEPQPYENILRQTEADGLPVEHLDIVNHAVDDLLMMLSALIQKIIEANDSLHPHHYHHASQIHQSNKFAGNVLAFHGRNVPAISIHAYLTRILKYCPVTNEVFLTLLVYFDRIAKRANAGNMEDGGDGQPAMTPMSDDNQLFVMDSYNIHRLIIAGITVASKFFSDIFYKNSRYAKVGGLPLEELNHLELQFLLLTDFKLMIQIEELQRYADLLLKFWKREQTKPQDQQQQQEQQQQQQQQQSQQGSDPNNDSIMQH